MKKTDSKDMNARVKLFLSLILTICVAAVSLNDHLAFSQKAVFIIPSLLLLLSIVFSVYRSLDCALKDSIAFSEKIRNTVPSGIVLINREGIVLSFNKEAEKITGYSEKEVINQKCTIWADIPCRSYCPVFRDDGSVDALQDKECIIKRKDGELRIILKNTNPLLENNEVVGTVESFVDITDRKKIEESYLLAKRESEQATRIKSEFLTMMSHEIRTPLNGIIGMASLIADTDLDDEQKMFIDTIDKAGADLLKKVNSILDYSKLESKKIELSHIDFDSRKTVDLAMANICSLAEAKGLEVTTLINADVPDKLNGDPERLQQLILSIGDNAVKFTNEGEIIFTVSVESETSDTALLRFEMKDSGIGISEEHISRLFKSFSQVDLSNTRAYGGTGISLAISKMLARLMGGDIGVNSVFGSGSTFWFTCLFKKVSEKAAQPQLMQGTKPGGLQVLIVSPRESVRSGLFFYFNAWGNTCVETSSSDEALKSLRHSFSSGNPFTLVVLDEDLHTLNGFEFSRMLRADDRMRSLHILMYLHETNTRGPEDYNRKIVDACIQAPIAEKQLVESVEKALTDTESVVGAQSDGDGGGADTVDEGKPERQRTVKNILIVEDDVVNREVMSKMLERAGHHCLIAKNGREALESLEETPVRLVLMDIAMPVMDGIDAVKAIRKKELEEHSNMHIPIIAVTAKAMKGDREKCLDAGMDDYVTKPLKKDVLLHIVDKWTSGTAVV